MITFTIKRWFDSHHHLRDGDMLRLIVRYIARSAWGGIIMPNLMDPITTVDRAKAYREEIEDALRHYASVAYGFQPKLTCYLTDTTSPDEIRRGFEEGVWVAAKLYFAGHTTNSHNGVREPENLCPVFEVMQEIGMPLLVHGEIPNSEHDIFDLEEICVEKFYKVIRNMYPALKICAEHMTTAALARFVEESGPDTFGTITPQHMSIDRNALFNGGLRPHNYCLPILKRRKNMLALQEVATRCDRVGAGTDSAPHPRKRKECCGCAAGCFNIIEAPSVYAQVFDDRGMFKTAEGLKIFEGFMSTNLPTKLYGFDLPDGDMVFQRGPAWTVPEEVRDDAGKVVVRPWKAGEQLSWQHSFRPRH